MTIIDADRTAIDSLVAPTPFPGSFAVSYLRVSTKEQAEKGGQAEGFSIPAQREANQRKADQLGATIIEEFVDAGESARKADRPELMRMIQYVTKHKTNYCIVHKVDRLARNRADDVSIHLALQQCGVMLVSASENIDETPSGMLLHGIMSTIAEFYSRNLASEVAKGMNQKARTGGTNGKAPIGYLNIRTIDSLLHLIVRAAALELDLHPDFQPVFATEEVLTPYLDALLEQAWQGNEVMRALLRDVYRALAWRENSTGFLAGEKLLNQLRGLLDDVLLGRFDNVTPADILHKRLSEVENLAVIHASNFQRLATAAGLNFNKNALAAVEAITAKQCKASAFLNKASASELFLKKPVVSDEVQKAYEAFARAASVLVDTAPMLRQAVSLAPVLLLARMLVEAFSANQQQEGSLPGLLIPHKARQVLENENGVPEALCRMGSRLTHFLVDEFQDTSREQWHALRPLLEEALSRGGSLTWVGDVKQSIYGWRDGDPELFDGILADRGLTAIAATTCRDSLPFNWRSSRQVVEHNNALFSPLEQPETARAVMSALLPGDMPPELREEIMNSSVAALVSAFEGTTQQCPEHAPKGGLVQVEDVAADSAELLREAVFARLSEILHEDIAPQRPWSDVLVLVRSNDGAARLADHLVLLDNGRVVASGPLNSVLSRIDLPAAFADDAGVVLDTRVAAHEADDLTRLEFPGGAIFVSHRPEAIGTALRCRIHARDVSLALVPQTQSSILNCVAATVIDLAPTDTPGHVLVRLDAEGTPLLARITQRSAARLDIRSGLAVHAQIKAVALLA